MKSWRCDCSRINPCFEDKCLSCEKTRPEFQPKTLKPMKNIPLDNADLPEFEKQVKQAIFDCKPKEYTTKDALECIFGKLPAEGPEKDQKGQKENTNQGFLPLLKTDSMPENKKQNDRKLDYDPKENDRVIYDLSKLSENENKVILETPAGKYVPLELLERALSEWNGRRKKPLTNDMLFQIFRNEFPELNLQVVGHEVKAV